MELEKIKQHYKEAILGLTYRERLKAIFNISARQSELSPTEMMEIVVDTFNAKQKKEWETKYFPLLLALNSQRERFYLYDKCIEYSALKINSLLEKKDEQTLKLLEHNLIIQEASIIMSKTSDPEIKKLLSEQTKRLQSPDNYPDIFFKVEKSTGFLEFVSYSEPMDIIATIKILRTEMSIAKDYYKALREFTDKHKITDLVPDELLDIETDLKRNLAYNLDYSEKYHDEITDKPEEERTEGEKAYLSLAEEKGYSSFHFPNYDRLEPSNLVSGNNNIFEAEWQRQI